jgi:uncharacterized protein YdhG (YjbR/CyaY superfamily)
MLNHEKLENIDEYISGFPENVQRILEKMRAVIKDAAPEALETISYQMPAFKLHGILVYFATHKNHIGFYPTASPIVAFKEALTPYKKSKGAVQFPLDKPVPFDMVKKIVEFRVKENKERYESKRSGKS